MAVDGLTLSGTNLNDETNYGLEAFEAPAPAPREEWATSADADGAGLVRPAKYENRVVNLTLRVGKQTTMDLALGKIGALRDLLAEAELNPGGVPLVFTPATGSKSYTLYVLRGEITGVPQVVEGSDAGFYVFAPKLMVRLVCKPFGYGAEEEVAAAKSIETGLSTVVVTCPTVGGDVPAEGRLVVKDTAKVGRRFVEWGLQNRYYDAATALIQAAESWTAVGGALSEAANTGAYKPGAGTKLTVATTLLPEPTICFETGVLKHVGTFRVKLRAQAVLGAESVAEKVKVRLSYQDGEGPFRGNEWQTPVLAGKYVEVDLGTVSLTEKVAGTQKWNGRVEAYSKNTAAKDVLHGNYLLFIPVLEGYGKARGQTSSAPGTVAAFDNFTTGTLSGALNARTPAAGAAWATSGATTDFTVEAGAAPRATNVAEAEPRFAVFGASMTNAAVTISGVVGPIIGSGMKQEHRTILRWTNASNYAFWRVERQNAEVRWELAVIVAGVLTILASGNKAAKATGNLTYTTTLEALTDGTLAATFSAAIAGGAFWSGVKAAGSSSVIATGGALASGKGGAADRCVEKGLSATPRSIVSATVLTLPAVPYVVQSERTLEVRSDCTLTQDSTGTYTGPPPEYQGSRFYLPQKGSAGRTSRIIVKADRNDLEESDQQTIGDAFTVQAFATTRFLNLPH